MISSGSSICNKMMLTMLMIRTLIESVTHFKVISKSIYRSLINAYPINQTTMWPIKDIISYVSFPSIENLDFVILPFTWKVTNSPLITHCYEFTSIFVLTLFLRGKFASPSVFSLTLLRHIHAHT